MKLNKEDILLLNKLLELSKKILKIYNNLYNLEINNKLNSLEYQKQLTYLNVCLELEEELYKQINYLKINDYITYTDRGNLFKDFSDYDLIINNFQDFLFAKRVYNRLNELNTLNIIDRFKDDLLDQSDFSLNIYLTNSIHDDIENSLVYLTYNYNDPKYQNKLKKIKYLVSFLNNRIENINIKNSFNNQDKLFLLSNSIVNLCNFNNKIYKKFLKIYYLKYLKKLLRIKNNEYKLIILKCLIKSYLILNSNDKELLNMNNEIVKNVLKELEQNNNIILLKLKK